MHFLWRRVSGTGGRAPGAPPPGSAPGQVCFFGRDNAIVAAYGDCNCGVNPSENAISQYHNAWFYSLRLS